MITQPAGLQNGAAGEGAACGHMAGALVNAHSTNTESGVIYAQVWHVRFLYQILEGKDVDIQAHF